MAGKSRWPHRRRVVLFLVATLICATVVVLSVISWVRIVDTTQSLAANGTHTTATVIALNGYDGSRNITPNYALVRFTPTGATKPITAACPVNHVDDYHLGARVAIGYDPHQPTRAVLLADPDPTQLIARFFAGVLFGGVGFLLCGSLLWMQTGEGYGRHARR